MIDAFYISLFLRFAAVSALFLVAASCTKGPLVPQPAAVDRGAQWVENCERNDAWDTPGPPYRIYGNTYYVGTCGIAAILVAGDQGHILIDGGTERGGELVAKNVVALGFDIKDVEILLHSHEHFDHVGGLATLQAQSGARVIASAAAAPVLRTGNVSQKDPQWGMHEPFPAVSVSATVDHQGEVTLGNLSLTAIATPGHSPGALSWTWSSCEREECKTMVYADSLSPISSADFRFSNYPNYVSAYRSGLAALTNIECDFVLTPHPVASGMHQRLSGASGLQDKNGCQDYVNRIGQRLGKRLATERASSP
ncbi:MAG: subclass B3 metallo-beta-lactamase [Lysobacterales bacterium]